MLARCKSLTEWRPLGLQFVICLISFQTEAESLAENCSCIFLEYSCLASLTLLKLYFDFLRWLFWDEAGKPLALFLLTTSLNSAYTKRISTLKSDSGLSVEIAAMMRPSYYRHKLWQKGEHRTSSPSVHDMRGLWHCSHWRTKAVGYLTEDVTGKKKFFQTARCGVST